MKPIDQCKLWKKIVIICWINLLKDAEHSYSFIEYPVKTTCIAWNISEFAF